MAGTLLPQLTENSTKMIVVFLDPSLLPCLKFQDLCTKLCIKSTLCTKIAFCNKIALCNKEHFALKDQFSLKALYTIRALCTEGWLLSSMEDNIQWKTTFNVRQPSNEDDLFVT